MRFPNLLWIVAISSSLHGSKMNSSGLLPIQQGLRRQFPYVSDMIPHLAWQWFLIRKCAGDPVASAQISTQTPSCQTVIEHVFCLAQIGYDHHVTNSRGTKGHVQDSMIPRPPIQPEQRPQHQNKPYSRRTRISSNQEAFISIKDKGFLRRYYEKIWENFQQTNCRVLAKAYVKLIEPRKQVTYPYNGRKIIAGKTHQLDPNETKPPWWPTGVSHREPDHLPKAGERNPVSIPPPLLAPTPLQNTDGRESERTHPTSCLHPMRNAH